MASRTLHLDTLDLKFAESAPGGTHSKQSVDGNPLTISGRVFERGIGSHANGNIPLRLDGKATQFAAWVGVDDEVGDAPASIIFRVIGDGRILWESPVMRSGDVPQQVKVPLTGVRFLTLVCNDASDFNRYDHADWADATITYEGEIPTLTSGRVRLEMADSTIAFNVSGDKLLETYFGPRLRDPSDYPGSGPFAYPTQWDVSGADNAISLIQADGKISLDLVYAGHQTVEVDENQTELTFKLRDPEYPVEVELHYLASKRENVLERWAVIRNTGDDPVTINHAASACIPIAGERHLLTTFSGTWGTEALQHEEELTSGVKEIQSHSGTRTSQDAQPAFMISVGENTTEDSGNVILGALAWSGNWRIRFEKGMEQRVNVQAGYNPHLARYTLAKGESLETPRLIVTHSNHGKGPATRNLHRWARRYGIRDGDQPRRILLNSWEGAYFKFDGELIKRMITDAAKTGIELFVLDDGWFGMKHPRNNSSAGLGDWMVNTRKIKGGIQGLIDHAKNEGIDFGIWVEPEMVNPSSELYETRPEWVIELPKRIQRLQRTQLGLDLSNPEVQEYIFKVMDDLLGQHPDISYVKWDCNRAISDPGSNYLTADRQEHLTLDYVKGYYEVLRRVTEKYPEVIFQACGSGGGRTDYGALKYHHEAWTSDNTDARERIRMQWSLNHIYPAIITASHVTEVPNHGTSRITPIKYRFDVAMTGRLGFELRPERVPAEDMEFSKQALSVYKSIRPVIQFGDLYRLKSPFEGDVASLMYVLDETEKHPRQAVFFAFTLDKEEGSRFGKIQLAGLDPHKRYQLTELNLADPKKPLTPYHHKEFGGDFLMDEGLTIPWGRGDYQSLVIQLEELAP